jgi:predicted metalloprotease with PDZ domain
MYFAVVDSEVREASGGKKSVDDLLLSMLARRRAGKPMDQAAWVETVTEAIGPRGKTELEAMLAGALQLPPSDEFGPCFRRTTKLLRRYELGFDAKVLVEPKRIVRDLVAGSAAEQAGLKNGDEILKPVPQDGIQGNQTATLTLEIRRDGRDFPITYLPRGETVDAYQWERVLGVPDKACAR